MKTKEQILNKFNEIKEALETPDLEYIKNLIRTVLRQVPIPTAILHKGGVIDRARLNTTETLYMKEQDISYIRDKHIIDNFIGYGRANKPKQVMFYGAIESTKIPQQRVTAIFETSKLLKNKEITSGRELITVSRWEILEKIELAEIIFSDRAVKNNPDILKSLNYYMKDIHRYEDREFILKQLMFFSNEFAKEIKNDFDYKISAAYTDLIVNETKIVEGIAYPSVASDYQGQNIVLSPDVVDSKLKLKEVITQKIIKESQTKVVINNDKYVKSFGLNNSSFEWEDISGYLQ